MAWTLKTEAFKELCQQKFKEDCGFDEGRSENAKQEQLG
jgi:hypothetical protein